MPGEKLSLAEKVGQLFMVGFEGTEVTPELEAWLRRFPWGGAILFGRNVESPTQLLDLTRALQAGVEAHGNLPLLIAIDQEGGRVARLKPPFTAFPSAAVLGQLNSKLHASDVGNAVGMELRAVGITMNMAPVLDVLTNPANTVIGDRAFGSDPMRVATLSAAFIRGMHAAEVQVTGKHFPGHGDTLLDSHVSRPVSRRSVAQHEACEFIPFREAIEAGVDALMTAHVRYPAWDPEYPATLSPRILTDVLRGQLTFQGVIVTDDLGMEAVAGTFPWEEIPLLALRAGADLLLICHDRLRQEQAYARVLRAVQRGELLESRVEQSVARIKNLKSRFSSHQTHGPAACASLACIGSGEHRALAAFIAKGVPHDGRTMVG